MEVQKDQQLIELEGILNIWRAGDLSPVQRIYWTMSQKKIFKLLHKICDSDSSILDVGCGTGDVILEMTELGNVCHGVDPLLKTSLNQALQKAKAKRIPVNLYLSQGEYLPFRAKSFDVVLCISTLQHVNDTQKTLSEIHRVLKDTGVLIISVPQTIRKSTFTKKGVYNMRFNIEILSDTLGRAGFQVVEKHVCGFFPPFTQQVLNWTYASIGESTTYMVIKFLNALGQYVPRYTSNIIFTAKIQD